METIIKRSGTTDQKKKKTIKRINYKLESEKYKAELDRLNNTIRLDLKKTVSLAFSFDEIFWLKSLLGNELKEIESDLNYYDDDEKLPPKKQGHKYLLSKISALENIYRKVDCLTL